MKILVIGANGRTGKQLVPILSGKNYQVISFEGDVLDSANVDKFVEEAEAVISVVGHVKGSTGDVQTRGIENVISAMVKHGRKRIISLTGSGVRVEGDQITITDKLLNFAVKLFDPKRVQDGIDHYKVLKKSDLDWTVVRVLKLTNQKPSTNWKLSLHGPVKSFIPRASVAEALVEVLENGSYKQQAPLISKVSAD